VRQDITWNALSRQVQLDGLPVEAQNPPPPAEELADGRVAFYFVMPGGVTYTTIPKSKLDSLIPNGGSFLGGDGVSNQTDEVKRLQAKFFPKPPAQGQRGYDGFGTYLTSGPRGGGERAGVAPLFALRAAARGRAPRRDLPLVARTSSQVA